MGKVYIVVIHEYMEGDRLAGVFDDKKLADEQMNWISENIIFGEDDYMDCHEFDIQDKINTCRTDVGPLFIGDFFYLLHDSKLQEDGS